MNTLTETNTVDTPIAQLPRLDVRHWFNNKLLDTLSYALTRRRGSCSRGEQEFVAGLSRWVPVTMIDGAGNLHVDARKGRSRTMFTAHTDTVHFDPSGEPAGPTTNSVIVDGKFWRADGDALGADDGAGVALLVHMIHSNVPGYYVFFRGEEVGGIGSKWLAENMPDLCMEFDRAVAFDRAGYSDVITKQAGGRCCSDKFADALAGALTTEIDWFLPDATGVYTDTAELTHLIPECTNVSVGYFRQHGVHEALNIEFLQRLATQVCKVDWEALPVVRKPSSEHAINDAYPEWGDSYTSAWGPEEDDLYEALDAAVTYDHAPPFNELMRTKTGYYLRTAPPELLQEAYDDLLNGRGARDIIDDLFDQLVIQ